MARESKFLKLYLPNRSDNYDVERDQNDNFLKLDAAAEQAQKMATDLFSKKQDKEDDKLATTDKTVVGAINESQGYTDGLAGLQGENTFPLSQATEGQVYKEPNSKKYYVCIRNYNGGEISVPNGNFEEINVRKNSEIGHLEKDGDFTVIVLPHVKLYSGVVITESDEWKTVPVKYFKKFLTGVATYDNKTTSYLITPGIGPVGNNKIKVISNTNLPTTGGKIYLRVFFVVTY